MARPSPKLPAFDPITRQVARAMALLWTFRTRAAIVGLLRLMGGEREDGIPIALGDVNAALERLRQLGQLVESPQREACFRLADELRRPLYSDLVAETLGVDLQRPLHALERFQPEDPGRDWPLDDFGATVGIVRLAMFSGMGAERLRQMGESIGRAMDWGEVLAEAAFAAFDGELFRRIAPEWRWELLALASERLCRDWQAEYLPLAEWALAELESGASEAPAAARLGLAEMLVGRGESARAEALLQAVDNGLGDALRACLLAESGQFAEAQAAFEAASRRRQAEAAARKRIFPASIAWFYPLALLARRSPAELETALKFCQGEAGSRRPEPQTGWGLWVHAIGARLGETALDAAVFLPILASGRRAGLEDLWRVLLAAWLGPDSLGLDDEAARERLAALDEVLRKTLAACRLDWLEAQVEAAAAVLGGKNPDPAAHFFVPGPSAAWRDVLAALQSLAEAEAEAEETGAFSRLLWSIRIGPDGSLEDIEAFEQRHGPRGWSKAKPASLARLATDDSLAAHDAMVARSIRADRNHPGRFTLDRPSAIMALVGHPGVVLAEAPEQMVELVEGRPEIELIRSGEGFSIRVFPPLRAEIGSAQESELGAEEKRELEALRSITLVRDSPQRLRLIRFTAAQRRAAQLLAEHADFPAAAREDLHKAMRSLAGHFQIQADQARGLARPVTSDSRLRAELSPVGEQLLLRLVVAPLGPDGPRLPPGLGRPRLLAASGGETVVARRDLMAERAHLEAVLDAFAFLAEPEDEPASYEWVIADPEDALTLLERLPGLPAIAAVDWPKGQHLRVVTIDTDGLEIRVESERDWFRMRGQTRLDEERVLQLAELLAAAQGESRFIPMGDGVYAALSRRLKQRLADLASLAEEDEQGIRLPRLASAWLDESLEGMHAQTDEQFRTAVERLRSVQAETISLPRSLRAELRSYQEEGFRWAMRLAAAGFGGCLADDMGLGKTLQALAVLLARAAGGPALVLAPTSVASNWRREAERFAPSLDVRAYGEGDREEALAGLGPGTVVIASYTLFQLAQERFAEMAWHTLIADEAQAIKNAAAKRSIAVFELGADFRLALSGTPVENRLAELWSIMRFVNPGLLGTPAAFNERFAGPIERNRDRHAQQRLRRLVAPFVLRRTKAQVLQELPPRTESILAVHPDEAEAAHYEALRRQAVDEAEKSLAADEAGKARLNILAGLTRLRRAACDPRLVTPGFEFPGAKVQAFADLAANLSANGHKALVFSQFVDFLALLRAELAAAGIAYQYLDGATPAGERASRVAAFQSGEGDLFLISLKAGGFGLNLTAADYVVITDPWWNPAAEDQAMGRAHRMGQTRPVTVYRMIACGTVEERIVELHRDKRSLAESVLAEGEAAELPATEDLVSLIRGERA